MFSGVFFVNSCYCCIANGCSLGLVLKMLCMKKEGEPPDHTSATKDKAPQKVRRRQDQLSVAEIKMVALDNHFIQPFLTYYVPGRETTESTALGQPADSDTDSTASDLDDDQQEMDAVNDVEAAATSNPLDDNERDVDKAGGETDKETDVVEDVDQHEVAIHSSLDKNKKTNSAE